jgi:GrpB-like predicted nucleotidyltransferase (UPF0157 family)
MAETLEDKIRRVTEEHVAVVTYDPAWPALFEETLTRLAKAHYGTGQL